MMNPKRFLSKIFWLSFVLILPACASAGDISGKVCSPNCSDGELVSRYPIVAIEKDAEFRPSLSFDEDNIPTFSIEADIANYASMEQFLLDNSMIRVIPTDQFYDVEFSSGSMPGGLGMIVFITSAEDYQSIPLADSIDVTLRGLQPGSYILVVDSFWTSPANTDVGPLLLTAEESGVVAAYAFEVDAEDPGRTFTPSLRLSFLSEFANLAT